MNFDPQRAHELLRAGVGRNDANFRDGQEDAIRHIVEGRGRLLVVQKTGWGKSFVYFIATKLLREGGNGPALLISPLLALMRNQISAAERMGVRAATINSDNQEEWTEIEARPVRFIARIWPSGRTTTPMTFGRCFWRGCSFRPSTIWLRCKPGGSSGGSGRKCSRISTS